MSIKFCPYCAKPWSRTPFCAYCAKDLRAFIQADEADESPSDNPSAAPDIQTDSDIAALDAIFTQAAKTPYIAALEPFEVESHGNGKYAIVGLKSHNSLFIEIPDCVDAIGDSAFEGCTAMEISLPESIILIGSRAFAKSPNLEAVKGLGDHVRVIADEAFADCPNLDVTLPEKARLGADVIRGTLPDQRKKTEEARKAEEARLAEKARKAEEARKAEAAKKAAEAFAAIWDIQNGALVKYKGNESYVKIPNCVTRIGNYAFANCSFITGIHIPDSVKSIGDHAFSNCSGLTHVTIPSSVSSIGGLPFSGCSSLVYLSLPRKLYSAGISPNLYTLVETSLF